MAGRTALLVAGRRGPVAALVGSRSSASLGDSSSTHGHSGDSLLLSSRSLQLHQCLHPGVPHPLCVLAGMGIFTSWTGITTAWRARVCRRERGRGGGGWPGADVLGSRSWMLSSGKPGRTRSGQMTKTDRNEPCPCGSGKRYKSCCLPKGRHLDSIPWPTFAEKFVVAELLRSSKEFAAFYKSERSKITTSVYWARDSSLPVGIDYRCTRLPDGTQVIRLRRIPAVPEDAMRVAHELQHLVLDSEGFPCTGAKPQYETISSSLNSMIHDPLVDARLLEYGFDLLKEYEAEVQEALNQLGDRPVSPSGHLERVHWMFNYVSKILDWRLLRDATGKDSSEFQSWFDRRYPDIVEDARGLLALIDDIGYDTPERQVELLGRIVQRYGLEGIVFL